MIEGLRALEAMPEYQRLMRVRSFGASLHVFRANWAVLERHLRNFTDNAAGLEMLGPGTSMERRGFMFETARHVHNLTAAGQALVGHMGKLHGEIYRKRNLFPEYRDEEKRRLYTDPAYCFIQALRNYLLHERTLPVAVNVNFQSGSTTTQVTASKKALEASGAFTERAGKYLAQCPANIELLPLMETYVRTMLDFHRWFAERQQQLHAQDIALVEAKQRELWAASAPHMIRSIEAALTVWRDHNLGTLADVFAGALTDEEREVLIAEQGNPTRLVEEAVRLIEQRFPLPAELVARVQEAARSANTPGAQRASSPRNEREGA